MPRSLPPGERKTTAWEPECRRAEDQAGVYCGDLLTSQGHAPRHLHWGGSHCRESLLCSKTAHPQQPQDRATIATGAFRSRPPSPTSCSSPGTEGSVTAPCPPRQCGQEPGAFRWSHQRASVYGSQSSVIPPLLCWLQGVRTT